MSLNTFPCNPYPISTEELNKGNNDDLNTRVSALETAVEEIDNDKADLGVIAAEFDAEAGTYEIGDLVTNEGKLYEFTSDHSTPGAWDPTEVTEKTVADEVNSVKSGLTNQGGNITPATNVTNDTVDYSIISRMGNVVTVFVSLVIGDSISAWNKLADLSAGFRPIHTTMAVGWMTTTSEPCLVRIGDDGSIMISKAVSTGKVQFLASYIVN